MKERFSLFAFLLFIHVFSQSAVIDTAQVVVPQRTNAAHAIDKPYLILISADGFRYDYAQKFQAENLMKLSGNGVRAKAMLPSYPSITFPNHWTLITGLYPSHHGLIDNYFYDYKRKESYAMNKKENAEDGSWYGGTPLWSLAEEQGMLSASLHWVGAASNAGRMRPTYYYHYHEKFTPQEKVAKVDNWLQLPEEQRPHFISLYFPETDAAGHYYGPDAPETERAVKAVDAAVGELVKRVSELGLKQVNFVFVSDHGMVKVNKESPLSIPEFLLDKSRFDVYNAQTLLRVVVKDAAAVKKTYRLLKKNKTEAYEVVLAKRAPRALHFSTRDDRFNRIGHIFLMPKAPNIFLESGKKATIGKHGYNAADTPEMKTVFYAWGPQFKSQMEIKEFPNVEVYPLMAGLLGLKINHSIDGGSAGLQNVLNK